jgi:hypothetical protein
MAKECTALEIEDGQALRRIAGLRRKHQVEERKVEGAVGCFYLFLSFCKAAAGFGGGATVNVFIVIIMISTVDRI